MSRILTGHKGFDFGFINALLTTSNELILDDYVKLYTGWYKNLTLTPDTYNLKATTQGLPDILRYKSVFSLFGK